MKNPEHWVIVIGIIVFTAIILYLVGKLRTSQKREEVSRKKIAAYLEIYEGTRSLLRRRSFAIPMLYESSNTAEIEQVVYSVTRALIADCPDKQDEKEREALGGDWPDDDADDFDLDDDVDYATYPRLIGNVLEVREDHTPVVIRVVPSPKNEDDDCDEDID